MNSAPSFVKYGLADFGFESSFRIPGRLWPFVYAAWSSSFGMNVLGSHVLSASQRTCSQFGEQCVGSTVIPNVVGESVAERSGFVSVKLASHPEI